jgi:hypothetical protein
MPVLFVSSMADSCAWRIASGLRGARAGFVSLAFGGVPPNRDEKKFAITRDEDAKWKRACERQR